MDKSRNTVAIKIIIIIILILFIFMVFIMLGLSDICANVIVMAEDKTEVLSVTESVIIPYGSFTNCVMNKGYSDIEPDVLDNKYYAQGHCFKTVSSDL